MNDDHDLPSRVARLEALVERLLADGDRPATALLQFPGRTAHSQPPAVSGPVAPPAEDPFFALNALKQVLPAPGGVVYAGSVDLPGGRHADWQYGLDTEALTGEDWSGRADSIAALSHPVRLQMLQEILLGMATAAQLSALDGVGTTGQVYHHLRTLVAAGWLQSTSRGQYEVPPVRIVPLLVLVLAARR